MLTFIDSHHLAIIVATFVTLFIVAVGRLWAIPEVMMTAEELANAVTFHALINKRKRMFAALVLFAALMTCIAGMHFAEVIFFAGNLDRGGLIVLTMAPFTLLLGATVGLHLESKRVHAVLTPTGTPHFERNRTP